MSDSSAAGAAPFDAAESRRQRNANAMSMLRHIRIKHMPNTTQLWFGNTHIATVEHESPAGAALQAYAADLPEVIASDHVVAAAPALLEALQKAAEAFEDYAREHRAKERLALKQFDADEDDLEAEHEADVRNEKAERNEQRAAMCRAAISLATPTTREDT